MQDPVINHGALLGRRPSDFVAGSEVGSIPYEIRNPSGNWTLHMPPGEWQKSSLADSMSCVSFSAINSIEAQERVLIGSQHNYSDRFLAKMSDTTLDGNYLWKVADTIRQFGLVLESDYPAPSSNYTWPQYHADIPEPLRTKLLAKGQAWLKKWAIVYEWIPVTKESLAHHLKHAPIQVVFPNHAVVAITCPKDIITFFDTYSPFFKDKAISQLTDALKIVLVPKQFMNQTKVVLSKDGKTVYKCVPVATDFDSFRKQAQVEGVVVPNPIPPSSSL